MVGPALVLPGEQKRSDKKAGKGKGGKGSSKPALQKRALAKPALGAGAAKFRRTVAEVGPPTASAESVEAAHSQAAQADNASIGAGSSGSADGQSSIAGTAATFQTGNSTKKKKTAAPVSLKNQAEKYLKIMDCQKALNGSYNPGKDAFQAGRVCQAITWREQQCHDAPVAEGTRLEARTMLIEKCALIQPGNLANVGKDQRPELVAAVCSHIAPLPSEFQAALCQVEAGDLALNTTEEVMSWLELVSPFRAGDRESLD